MEMKNAGKIAVVFICLMTMICGCGKNSNNVAEIISDEQAVNAIRNYCCTLNPDLESIAAEEYPVYWEIVSSDDSEIVVLYRSYTGAQVRYYIDRTTGSTNVTEFVPAIMDDEEPADESFNVRDYFQ